MAKFANLTPIMFCKKVKKKYDYRKKYEAILHFTQQRHQEENLMRMKTFLALCKSISVNQTDILAENRKKQTYKAFLKIRKVILQESRWRINGKKKEVDMQMGEEDLDERRKQR